jgi:hypothetical protein
MNPAPQETACQGGGVPGACRGGTPCGPGGTLRTLDTPGTRATPWRGGCQGLSQTSGHGGPPA